MELLSSGELCETDKLYKNLEENSDLFISALVRNKRQSKTTEVMKLDAHRRCRVTF